VPADRLDRLTPDTWTLDQALLDRPGNKEVQLQLFYDYQFNLDAYPAFQDYFRSHRPPTLIAWGKHDEIFGADGARAYLRDLPDAELHLLDAGHFALETHGDEIAALVRDFLDCVVDRAFTRVERVKLRRILYLGRVADPASDTVVRLGGGRNARSSATRPG
jgi:pimeloyl-ACP methyl ester carboxylesterase